MSRQDKATTERNARLLRDLVKQPDNKACADCRKNDARWASWNLGVYLCIRCSGIHRAMGTHISKVKSIDLDIWQPEQMESIQQWGNRRANAYWERHLKAGHVPPEHKIESFIRSKYESRRWAMEGPVPRDPSVLDNVAAAKEGGTSPPPVNQTSRPAPTPTTSAPAPRPGAQAHPLLSRQTRTAPPKASAPAPLLNFFDDEPASAPAAKPTSPPAPQPAAAPAAPSQPPATTGAAPPGPTAAPGGNIFDLDFKPPTPQPKPSTNKADIMSLFSQAPTQPQTGGFFQTSPPTQQFGTWSGGVTASSPPQAQPTTSAVPTWGFNDQAAWGSGAQQQQQPQPVQQQPQQQWGQQNQTQSQWGQPQQAQQSQWGQPQQQQQQQGWGQTQNSSGWEGADPWAQPAPAAAAAPAQPAAKKDDRDPFANIWG